jgi:hypothetical protein
MVVVPVTPTTARRAPAARQAVERRPFTGRIESSTRAEWHIPRKAGCRTLTVRSSDPISGGLMSELTERELKLTAIVYCKHGAAKYLREHGRLPDKIGGLWSVIPMRLALEERGTDPVLTHDEQCVYDAILRANRLPGGAVRLVNP